MHSGFFTWIWTQVPNTVSVFFFKIYLLCILPYLHVCLLARRGHQISLWMLVSYHACGCWELNSGSLQEQPVLLTSEPSLKHEFWLLKWIFLNLYFCICVCTCRGELVGGDLKRVSDFLELELQVVLSHFNMGAGNQTLLLWGSSTPSYSLSHFSSPLQYKSWGCMGYMRRPLW